MNMENVNKVLVRKILLRTYNLLKSGWTQGTVARNVYGNPVSLSCENAVRFDLLGALMKSATSTRSEIPSAAPEYVRAFTHLKVALGHDSLTAFNNSKNTKHENVLNVVRAAMKLAAVS